MQEKICVRCTVSGKVQGVWFRAGTQQKAAHLGLTGWVRNLPDGRVQVLACGEKDAVSAMLDWLKEGPELAKVSSVAHTEVDWKNFERFSIL